MRVLKIVGALFGAGMVLVIAAIGFVTSRPGGDFIKARFAGAMLEQKQRTLKIDGPLELFLWPKLGLKLAGLTLSEPGGATEFAAVDSARISVDARSLLANQVNVDAFEAAGVRANLIRHQDGTLNIDDLFPRQTASSAPPQIDLPAVKLVDVQLTWRDEKSGATKEMTGDIGVSGLHFTSDALTLENLAVDLALTLSDMPGRKLKLAGEGQLHAGLREQTAAGRLAAKLDQSKLAFKFDVVRYAPLSLVFDLDIDSLDIDHYLPEKPTETKAGDGGFDLSFLKEFDVRGTVRIGNLQAAKVKATGLKFRITAANGKLDIASIATDGGRGKGK